MSKHVFVSSAIFLSSLLLGSAGFRANAIDGKHVNGISVFTQWFSPFDVNNPDGPEFQTPRGPIVKATIVNNKAVSWDTLYDSIGQYPAINAEGTKVAFFRWGQRVTIDLTSGRMTPIAGTKDNPSYLSIVNMDGTGLINLIQVSMVIDNQWEGEGNDVLDWPAGDWIYYEKPHKSGDVRKINIRTREDVHVDRNDLANKARRWSLSLDAKIAASQGGNFANGPGGNYQFPWNGKNIYADGCNMAVSASGNILAHYFGGCHNDLDIVDISPFNWIRPNPFEFDALIWIDKAPDGTQMIEKWIGKIVSYTKCADLIRMSVNSDKWALRQIGWWGQGNDIAKGANQVIVNWVDSTAILGNPYLPPGPNSQFNAPQPRGQYVNADAGDFYITGDATHPNSVPTNGYEDRHGVWHQVLPATAFVPSEHRRSPASAEILADHLSVRIWVGSDRRFRAQLLDCQGRIIAATTAADIATLQAVRPGHYLVQIECGGISTTYNVVLAYR